jgi:probable HAF family extracellular repeat protein
MRTATGFGHAMSPGFDGRFGARRLVLLACLLLGFVVVVPGAASAAPLYTVTDLGTLPGYTNSYASGVNDSGQIVGWNDNGILGPFNPAALSYTPARGMVDLGTLPGASSSIAYGVSESGQIVGQSWGSGYGHAFSYTPAGGWSIWARSPGEAGATPPR